MRLVWSALLALPALALAQQPGTVSSQTAQSQRPNPQAVPPTRPEDLCSIEGKAVNAVSGEPLKKAQITMNVYGGPSPNHGAVTDASGRFVIENVEPGSYNLAAERNGFVRLEYGARGPDRMETPLLLGPGQRTRDLVFRLLPQGVIAGHVVDVDGEPVEYAQIVVLQSSFVRGKRQMVTPAYGSTDDQGEYRVFGLAPGKYYLSVTYRPRNGMTMTQDRKPAEATNEGYAPTYFLGTSDPRSATPIEVSAGAVLGGTDITLKKTRTVRIRGHIVNPTGEGLPPWIMIQIMPKDGASLNFAARAMVQARAGAFEIRDLTPGSYLLMARWADENKGHMIRQPVDVGNNNLDDLSVLLTPGLSINGQVRVDGTAEVNLASVLISLTPQGPMPMGGAHAMAKDDGTFSFENVNADNYSVLVLGLPPTFYVKSIRMGDVDGLDAGLDLTRGTAGVLDILVSPNGGEVDGSVVDAKGQPASGAKVVIVPDARHRERQELFKAMVTDTSGHFSLKGISPGEYKLFAWEDMETDAYQDPEFLQPFENQGESLTIREGSRENRQLKVIPAESTPKNSGTER